MPGKTLTFNAIDVMFTIELVVKRIGDDATGANTDANAVLKGGHIRGVVIFRSNLIQLKEDMG